MSHNHQSRMKTVDDFKERVFCVSVQLPSDSDDEVANSLDELQRLIETLGGMVVGRCIQKRSSPSSATFIGKGKTLEIAEQLSEMEISLVAFDNELSGSQLRELEKILDCRVIDRTGIILDIFSLHARTKEAKDQVELASLEYLSTRLTRRWIHLERQRGGIGLKGVGEKQIEIDRRSIRDRISRIKQRISDSENDKRTQRRHRDKFLRVALVGYTNAGKSTLMNSLTASEVYVDDALFATLDSTVRVLDPKTRPPILMSDTVGFIRKLPHTLVASFRSTLQEVLEAELLLHVVDLSAPLYINQMEATQEVLKEIGADTKPMMLIFNKADMVGQDFLPKIVQRRYINCVVVSAFRPDDMVKLRDAIYQYFEKDMIEMDISVPYDNVWLQNQLFEYSRVLKKEYLETEVRFKVRIVQSMAARLKLLGSS